MKFLRLKLCCFRYHKGTDFQANHNFSDEGLTLNNVVLDTTKVQIFKQITTISLNQIVCVWLFQIPQRYRFSSKSQRNYIKLSDLSVVLDTTKVQIFKQITTRLKRIVQRQVLFQIPQRYRFSSKSQRMSANIVKKWVVLDTTKVQIFKQITTAFEEDTTNSELFQIPQRYRFSSKSQLMRLSLNNS